MILSTAYSFPLSRLFYLGTGVPVCTDAAPTLCDPLFRRVSLVTLSVRERTIYGAARTVLEWVALGAGLAEQIRDRAVANTGAPNKRLLTDLYHLAQRRGSTTVGMIWRSTIANNCTLPVNLTGPAHLRMRIVKPISTVRKLHGNTPRGRVSETMVRLHYIPFDPNYISRRRKCSTKPLTS